MSEIQSNYSLRWLLQQKKNLKKIYIGVCLTVWKYLRWHSYHIYRHFCHFSHRMGPPSDRQWLTQLKESAWEKTAPLLSSWVLLISPADSVPTLLSGSEFFFLGGGVGQTTRKAVPLLTNLLVFTYTAPWPRLSAIERVLPLITFSISSCDYSCNIFTAEQLESEQSKVRWRGFCVKLWKVMSGRVEKEEKKSVFASLLTSSTERCWLGYLPANCLIGELFHPIELLLHFRSLAGPSFRSNAAKPGLWFVMKFTGPLPLVFSIFPPGCRYDREKQARAMERPKAN